MNTSTPAAILPAQTVAECVAGLIESGSISAGARLTAIAAITVEARRRGFDPSAAISGDNLDALVVDAIPAHLWTAA